MASTTTNLGLKLLGTSLSDKETYFEEWRQDINGESSGSNMNIIDSAYKKLADNTTWYGTCSTAAGTQEKAATITWITSLETGLMIRIKFTNAQTYNGNPTFNLNSLGARPMMTNETTQAVRYAWNAGEVLDLVYDGTNWVIDGRAAATTTYYGTTKLSSSVTSTSETLAATPKAVKTAYDLANQKLNADDIISNSAIDQMVAAINT